MKRKCPKCNRFLGFIKDDIKRLNRCKNYLQNSQARLKGIEIKGGARWSGWGKARIIRHIYRWI